MKNIPPKARVMQTKFTESDGEGNCFAACVASILGLEIGELPKWLPSKGSLIQQLKHWASSREMLILDIRRLPTFLEYSEFVSVKMPVIAGGISPRGENRQHAVVGHVQGYSFDLVHDPHPSGDGLVGEPIFLTWIIPTHGQQHTPDTKGTR